jgi:hypothetical protein
MQKYDKIKMKAGKTLGRIPEVPASTKLGREG